MNNKQNFPQRGIRIISNLFDASPTGNQSESKPKDDQILGLFERDTSIINITQQEIDNLQSKLNFKRQQKQQMLKYLNEYKMLNKMLINKVDELEKLTGLKKQIQPLNHQLFINHTRQPRLFDNKQTPRNQSIKSRQKRKLSLVSLRQ